jgi:hypothetical protein
VQAERNGELLQLRRPVRRRRPALPVAATMMASPEHAVWIGDVVID